jgi:hypothetical protein
MERRQREAEADGGGAAAEEERDRLVGGLGAPRPQRVRWPSDQTAAVFSSWIT